MLPPLRLKKAPSDCCGRPRFVGLVDDESVASSLAPALGPEGEVARLANGDGKDGKDRCGK